MPGDRLPDRIADQFSGRGRHADIWRGLDRVLRTDRFLNLGYSAWYQPVFAGSSQRRLAARVGRRLAQAVPRTAGRRLLDVGTGRGGPAVELSNRHGFEVTGVDLVPNNAGLARANARGAAASAAFVVGDATDLPFRDRAFAAGTAIDAIVYVPEKPAAFAELARVVEDDAVAVITDLVVRDDAPGEDREAVEAFAAAWDMPPLPRLAEYRAGVTGAGFAVESVEDISPHSIRRFRKWAWLYLATERAAGGVLERIFDRYGLDGDAITHQVRTAYRALPSLAHVLLVARRRSPTRERPVERPPGSE